MVGKEWTQSTCTLNRTTWEEHSPARPRCCRGLRWEGSLVSLVWPRPCHLQILWKKKQTTNKYPWLILHSITVQKSKTSDNIHWCRNKEDTHPTTATPTWHGLCSFVWLWGQNSTSCAATRSPTIAPPVAPP